VLRKAEEVTRAAEVARSTSATPQPVLIYNAPSAVANASASTRVSRRPFGCGCFTLLLVGVAIWLVASAVSLPPPVERARPDPIVPAPADAANPAGDAVRDEGDPTINPAAAGTPVTTDAPAAQGETLEERARRERSRTLEIRKARRGR
jgi:hypothetical protein